MPIVMFVLRWLRAKEQPGAEVRLLMGRSEVRR